MDKAEPQVNIGIRNHEHPPLAINTITSGYLSNTVSGLAISFLVDTGAGVSLMNGKVRLSRKMRLTRSRYSNRTVIAYNTDIYKSMV